jgi:hypothetical protein
MKCIRSYGCCYAKELIIRKLRPPETQRTRFQHHEARPHILIDPVSNEIGEKTNPRFNSMVSGFFCFVAEGVYDSPRFDKSLESEQLEESVTAHVLDSRHSNMERP